MGLAYLIERCANVGRVKVTSQPTYQLHIRVLGLFDEKMDPKS